MFDHLDDPVPRPAPDLDRVLGRGRALRRRRTAVVSAAGALVLVAAAGTGVALLQPADGRSSLMPADPGPAVTSDAPVPTAVPPTGPGASPSPPSAATGSPFPTAAGEPYCATAQLAVSVGGPSDGAAGTRSSYVLFRNDGTADCLLNGHPGVSYVAGEDGHQVGVPADAGRGGARPAADHVLRDVRPRRVQRDRRQGLPGDPAGPGAGGLRPAARDGVREPGGLADADRVGPAGRPDGAWRTLSDQARAGRRIATATSTSSMSATGTPNVQPKAAPSCPETASRSGSDRPWTSPTPVSTTPGSRSVSSRASTIELTAVPTTIETCWVIVSRVLPVDTSVGPSARVAWSCSA
jgi:hypothetical protein